MFGTDHKRQLEFADWLQTTREDDHEKMIRDLATKALDHLDRAQKSGINIPFNVYLPSGPTYFSPNNSAAPAATTVHNLTIDIDPWIQGFTRRLVVEYAVREALDEIRDDQPEAFRP